MFLGLRIAVDDELLNGDGTGAHLEGLLHVSGVQGQTFATDNLTTLRKALTKLQLVFATPTGLVIHPNDAEDLDLTTDDTGRYYFAGPARSGASPVWSTPTVVTPSIAEGTALMGDFAGSAGSSTGRTRGWTSPRRWVSRPTKSPSGRNNGSAWGS
jgi:HK97 family phage major capsid protein